MLSKSCKEKLIQWLRVLAAPLEDQGSVLNTHGLMAKIAVTPVPGTPMPSAGLCSYIVTDTHLKKRGGELYQIIIKGA